MLDVNNILCSKCRQLLEQTIIKVLAYNKQLDEGNENKLDPGLSVITFKSEL